MFMINGQSDSSANKSSDRPTCAVTTLQLALFTSHTNRHPAKMDADMRKELVKGWVGYSLATNVIAGQQLRRTNKSGWTDCSI